MKMLIMHLDMHNKFILSTNTIIEISQMLNILETIMLMPQKIIMRF